MRVAPSIVENRCTNAVKTYWPFFAPALVKQSHLRRNAANRIMSTPEIDEAIKDTDLWFTVLKSLFQFDEMEMRGVVRGLLSPTLPEECVQSIYYRTTGNVSSLLELNSPKHFQAIGMLARSIFELAVDIGIFNLVKGAPIKMRVFLDIEKLRACRSAVAFAKNNSLTLQHSVQPQRDYITNNETRIMGLAATTWPGVKLSDLTHWSGTRLPARVKMLPVDMLELYDCFYRQLSWSVHSGLEGSYGLQPSTFARMCGMAFNFAARNYEKVLTQVIRSIKLDRADPLIENKMKLARFLPFTNGAQDEGELRRDLGI